MRSGHRDDAFRVGCESFLEGSHGDRVYVLRRAGHRALHHFMGHYSELLASCCAILPLTRQSDQVFADAAPWLFEVTGGSIGRLRSLLRRAAIDAITSGRERVTMADMEVFANQGGHSHKPASTPRAARNLDAASA